VLGDVGEGARKIARCVVETAVGMTGMLDEAASMGLPGGEGDCGETLHIGGCAGGPYVELPVLGPSTGRDTVGKVADFLLNPVPNVLTREGRRVVSGTNWASRLGARHRFRDMIDSTLYSSSDSYEQLRLNYLDSRRYALRGGDTLDQDTNGWPDDPYVFDPYEE